MSFSKETLRMNIIHNIVKFTFGLPFIVAFTLILSAIMTFLIVAGNAVCLIGAILSGNYEGFKDLKGLYTFTWEGLTDLWGPIKPK